MAEAKDGAEEAVLAELGVTQVEQEADLLALPHFMEVNLVATQRQLWRNTAAQARYMMRVAHACGNKEDTEAWASKMREAISRIIQIDAMYPDAKVRMQEMDNLAELVENNQRGQQAKQKG